ncbi:hypothetical protein [Levilactobacillus acidifarinae]|uniref:Glycosyl transferase, group i n=1 Tax=Levilactobacillus acidifarinae DSM 19394 = JCM 15949 TaxID=1423715 RepID=A0A0R1LPU1_9LACO|nr:hypothetical protein [Levilactobacillus acidifarinae]KRK94849.1 glycosyl transferase, group i [Levilactobacillus acidifarinae DSM 19394]GEO68608.1 glycosyl transferase family 1 [Levilactobacillus acidifarinae]
MKKSVIKELKGHVVNLGDVQDGATGNVRLALSVSDRRHRAAVQFFQGASFNQAWAQITDVLATTPMTSWVRIEVVQAVQRITLSQLQQKLKALPRMNYWRQGVSFDADFQTALLEMEINGHAFFKPGPQHKIGKNLSDSWIDFKAVERYLTRRNGQPAPSLVQGAHVWTFLTAGIFFDGDRVHVLNQAESSRGIRQMIDLNGELQTTIDAGEQFLHRQIKADGKFIYGYYPAQQRILSSYNTVRHFSSIYALLEAIQFTGRSTDLPQVNQALQWGIDQLTMVAGDARFVIEQRKNGTPELKLGAQAMLILALCKYQEVAHDDKFLPVLLEAYRGVTRFLQPSGRFNHVLNPDLTVKEAFRIIYYEGEITFALARLYQVTQDAEVARLVQQTLDFMVDHDYGKYHDHWLAYAINEALQIFPVNRDYMRMGLQNVYDHLTFIEQRDTAYPTLLELLNAAVKMTDVIKRTGNEDLLEPYDLGRLRLAWRQRAEHELLTGSFQPELAMYFYYPEKFIGGFFARHDNFRTRIDDCEHFLSGLINYYDYANQGVTR